MRDSAARRQSPYLSTEPITAYDRQLEAIVDKQVEPEVYNALKRVDGVDHVHHWAPLKTLDKLYNGLTAAEMDELTAYLEAEVGGIGNFIGNVMPIPGELHQPQIHTFMRAAGYEPQSNITDKTRAYRSEAALQGLISSFAEDIEEASHVNSLDYRKHIAKKYLTEAVPIMKREMDTLLNLYYNADNYIPERRQAKERTSKWANRLTAPPQ